MPLQTGGEKDGSEKQSQTGGEKDGINSEKVDTMNITNDGEELDTPKFTKAGTPSSHLSPGTKNVKTQEEINQVNTVNLTKDCHINAYDCLDFFFPSYTA